MGRRVGVATWVLVLSVGCGPEDGPGRGVGGDEATFVSGDACAPCHAEQAQAWRGSHHDLAMQPAEPGTVLGDFDDAELTRSGVTTRFFRRDGGYWVSTDGVDGVVRDFQVRYSFGAEPLQQYLVELERGRYQALTIAWDARAAADGGQRWFDLYPGERVTPDDPLHWTQVSHSWNASCAECHSTNLLKRLNPSDGSYTTTWSSDDVDCEACHGPGSLHAASPQTQPLALARVERAWRFAAGEAIAERAPAPARSTEIEVCAQCHARRSQFSESQAPREALLDAFRPELLDAGLYHADGQILDEVYEYGSFIQSPMHAAGVTCSDCHDPHSGSLRATGNALCATCHLPSTFDTPDHHRHTPGLQGAACVDCHMPARTYMVVDERRDHGFRVPRPDLSVGLGVPNACNSCHEDRTSDWAAAAVAAWFPDGRQGTAHYAQALHAGRSWAADRSTLLAGVIEDREAPAIVRATAISLLSSQPEEPDISLVVGQLADPAPLVQLAAIEALTAVPVEQRVGLARAFLRHSVATLRMAAARVLLPGRTLLADTDRQALDAALAEYVAAQTFNADRPEGLMNLGNLQAELGALGDAEATYRRALDEHPYFVPVYVNLADLYRQGGREQEAESLLRQGIVANPDDAGLHHALGLSLVRSGRADEALPRLREASERGADDPLYVYVYGVALHSTGDVDEALGLLGAAHERFPGYAPTLFALTTMQRDAGNLPAAQAYVRRLLDVAPTSARALALELGVATEP